MLVKLRLLLLMFFASRKEKSELTLTLYKELLIVSDNSLSFRIFYENKIFIDFNTNIR